MIQLKTLAIVYIPVLWCYDIGVCLGGRLGRVAPALLGRTPPEQGLGEVLRRLPEHQQAPTSGHHYISAASIGVVVVVFVVLVGVGFGGVVTVAGVVAVVVVIFAAFAWLLWVLVLCVVSANVSVAWVSSVLVLMSRFFWDGVWC